MCNTVQDGVVDKCLDRREVQHVKHRTSDLNFEEGVMGVSTHYQNNSSDLFMLAPVVSPPLTNSVHKWLLNDGTGTHWKWKIGLAGCLDMLSVEEICNGLMAFWLTQTEGQSVRAYIYI